MTNNNNNLNNQLINVQSSTVPVAVEVSNNIDNYSYEEVASALIVTKLVAKNLKAIQDILQKRYEAFAEDMQTSLNLGETITTVDENGRSLTFGLEETITHTVHIAKLKADAGININVSYAGDDSLSKYMRPKVVTSRSGLIKDAEAGDPVAQRYVNSKKNAQLVFSDLDIESKKEGGEN
jgi:hypothetical protein